MDSAQVRQSFLDFFKERGHTIVPSASLMPSSPNLLFTNSGMNQFVPYFLGEKKAPYPRAADTQKCIRAGGKHNDLDDVGFDTYHHTFFEMLGNWSFGDYFKKESLTWGWELLTKVWGLPKKRLFVTVYNPDKTKGDPAEFDQEAYDIWAEIFKKEGLDPAVHIVNGNKKDNFWMMGDTGPCGPCSEIHVNLLPSDDENEGRKLVNGSSSRCIEIWNHVFIQLNATADGKFSPLPARHVDTGMGFERVAGIIATTKGFTDFSAEPSNYNADVFTKIFDEVAKLSGKAYTNTVPTKREGLTAQEQTDVAFRVVADHIRTVSCAIADGILPSNEGRNYVIRRILRRAIMYSRKLELKTGDLAKLSATVVENLGSVFPELEKQKDIIAKVIANEEEMFGKTLGKGLYEFLIPTQSYEILKNVFSTVNTDNYSSSFKENTLSLNFKHLEISKEIQNTLSAFKIDDKVRSSMQEAAKRLETILPKISSMQELQGFAEKLNIQEGKVLKELKESLSKIKTLSGSTVFKLYDTYGFPLDLTEVLATERGLSVDKAGFEVEMEKQRERARGAQKKTDITVQSGTQHKTEFVGYDTKNLQNFKAKVLASESGKYVIVDRSPFYAEMGGQVGDTGTLEWNGRKIEIVGTKNDANGQQLHLIKEEVEIPAGTEVTLSVDTARRTEIEKHHSATHLLDWALREKLGGHIRQAGSLVAADRLRFDFAHFSAVDAAALKDIERAINEKIGANGGVKTYEIAFKDKPADVVAVFGEKYADTVRVVDIGGYSKELCGGTHVKSAGEIGVFKILHESAIAAGTRRIEAVAGDAAKALLQAQAGALDDVAKEFGVSAKELPAKIQKVKAKIATLEQKMKVLRQQTLQALKADLILKAKVDGAQTHVRAVLPVGTSAEDLRDVAQLILGEVKEGTVVLGSAEADKANVLAAGSKTAVAGGFNAGNVIKELTTKLDGKGGGRPEMAQGSGKAVEKLAEAIG